jgi:hypothetical protein
MAIKARFFILLLPICLALFDIFAPTKFFTLFTSVNLSTHGSNPLRSSTEWQLSSNPIRDLKVSTEEITINFRMSDNTETDQDSFRDKTGNLVDHANNYFMLIAPSL